MTLKIASQNESRNTQEKQESQGEKSEEKKANQEKSEGKKAEEKKSDDQKVEAKKEDAAAKEDHSKESKAQDDHSKQEDHKKDDHKGESKDDHAKDDHAKDGHDHSEKHSDGHGGHGNADPLSADALFSHVLDSEELHFSPTLSRLVGGPKDGVIKIPQPLKGTVKIEVPTGEKNLFKPLDLSITRLMVVELIAAVIIFVVFTWLARQIKSDRATKGRIAGLLETIVQFVRKDVGIAVMGKADGRRFAPFLLTIFFFVLGCNLLGMIPTVGAPTGDILFTGSLALCVFATVVYAGMMKFGFIGFFGNLVPTMGVEGPLGIVLSIGMFFIELFGFFVKHFVLAVRLFANIMAGHMVLAAIIGFIAMTYDSKYGLVYLVAPASVAGSVALSCLEVFVAFLQAYVFTFLSALFISSATHKH